ncbi:MAG: hypothetical protein ABSG59_20170, partial [Verrucomicrobiota bacterium]
MGRAETEEISQNARILFFQRKKFFARSQAAFPFHGTSLAYSMDKIKACVDGFAQVHGGNGSWFRREYGIGRALIPRQESFHRTTRSSRWPRPKSFQFPNHR